MIPKVIHYLWLSDEKTPEAERCIASWREHLTGYEIKEWNRHNFPYEDFIWAREAYSKQKWAFVTDLFRLWVLDRYGGIYMDADVVVTGTFDPFLEEKFFSGTELSERIGAHCMGAEKGHPFVHQCLQYYKDRHFILEDGSLDITPMPFIITKIFMKMYHYDDEIIRFDDQPFRLRDISIYPETFFTINIFDGCNVCYHLGLSAWSDQRGLPSDNAYYYNVNKHYCYQINRLLSGWKRWLYLLTPVGIIARRWRRRLKIRNVERIQAVDLNGMKFE